MEFEKLTRRELQTLCKKNKIPANITNVAMTQALKSLSFVEGIEEIMKPSQSETAQTFVESPERKEVSSPRIPPTGRRTTRRRTAMKEKEESETLQPVRTTRHSTRKTLAADDTQTPSVVQTTTRRARVNSVCRKMDSQLKECEDEEKKMDTLVTPAPSGVSTRRRRGMKEESVVYSTRRSVRLAAKKVDVPDLKVDVFSKEGEKVNMNINDSLDNVEEASGVTGNDANATAEKNFEQSKELEVVSAKMHYMQIDEGDDNAANVDTLEGIGESKDVEAERKAPTGKETEQEAAFEEERVHESEIDNRKLDGKIINVKTSVEEDLEENSEQEEEELEFVATPKHGIQIGEGDIALTVYNLEGKGEMEDVQSKENAHAADKEIEQEAVFEKESEDNQKLDKRISDVSNSAEGNSKEIFQVSAQKHYMRIGDRITGNDANGTVDKNSGQKDEVEVISVLSIKNGEEGKGVEGKGVEGKGELEDVELEEIEQEATFDEETVQKKTGVGSQELDGESIDVISAVEISEEELELAQKHHMQIGKEGDDNAAVANLDGKGESEHVTAEEHAHIGEENEVAPCEERTEQKSEVDEQKLDRESIHGKAGEDGIWWKILMREWILVKKEMTMQLLWILLTEKVEMFKLEDMLILLVLKLNKKPPLR